MTVFATRSAVQISNRSPLSGAAAPRWHSGECRLFPLIMVFYWDKAERKCCWFSSLGPDWLLPLILWRRVNKMSTAASSLRRKRGEMEMWRGAISSQITSVVPCCSDTEWRRREGGREEEDERRGGKSKGREGKTEEWEEDERPFFLLFLPLSHSGFWENFLKWGMFLLMAQLWKWKRCSAWLTLLSLTPNGKKIFLHALLSGLWLPPRTIITQSHTHLLFSFHTHTHTFSTFRHVHTQTSFLSLLLTFSFPKSPSLLALCCPSSCFPFPSPPGWPWAAAASEVAKVQSQYEPTKLVKY